MSGVDNACTFFHDMENQTDSALLTMRSRVDELIENNDLSDEAA